MIEIIESKITDIVTSIVAKPVELVTKEDYDILAGEYYRLTCKQNAESQNKRLAEMLAVVNAK